MRCTALIILFEKIVDTYFVHCRVVRAIVIIIGLRRRHSRRCRRSWSVGQRAAIAGGDDNVRHVVARHDDRYRHARIDRWRRVVRRHHRHRRRRRRLADRLRDDRCVFEKGVCVSSFNSQGKQTSLIAYTRWTRRRRRLQHATSVCGARRRRRRRIGVEPVDVVGNLRDHDLLERNLQDDEMRKEKKG